MRLKGEYEVRTAPGPARRGALHRAAAAAAQSRHIPSAVAAVAKRRGGANADAEAEAKAKAKAKAVLWSAGQTPRGEAAAR